MSTATARSGRLAAGVPVVLAVVLAVGATSLALRGSGPSGVAAAQATMRNNSRFYNGPTAASAFASAGHALLVDGRSCTAGRGAGDARCRARLSGAAWAQVSSVQLLSCTQPGVYQARHDLEQYLGAVVALDRGQSRTAPTLPPVVVCS